MRVNDRVSLSLLDTVTCSLKSLQPHDFTLASGSIQEADAACTGCLGQPSGQQSWTSLNLRLQDKTAWPNTEAELTASSGLGLPFSVPFLGTSVKLKQDADQGIVTLPPSPHVAHSNAGRGANCTTPLATTQLRRGLPPAVPVLYVRARVTSGPTPTANDGLPVPTPSRDELEACGLSLEAWTHPVERPSRHRGYQRYVAGHASMPQAARRCVLWSDEDPGVLLLHWPGYQPSDAGITQAVDWLVVRFTDGLNHVTVRPLVETPPSPIQACGGDRIGEEDTPRAEAGVKPAIRHVILASQVVGGMLAMAASDSRGLMCVTMLSKQGRVVKHTTLTSINTAGFGLRRVRSVTWLPDSCVVVLIDSYGCISAVDASLGRMALKLLPKKPRTRKSKVEEPMPLPEVHLHYLIRTASGPTARLRRPQAHNSREHAFSLCTAIVTPPTPHNNTTATNPDPSNRSQPGAQSGPVARLICTDGQTLSIIRYQIERAPGLARKVSSLRNLQAAGTVSVQAQASALPVLAPIRTNIQMRPMRLPADYQPPGEAQDGLATAVIHSVSKSPHTGRPVPQPAAPAPAADTPSAAARKPKLSVLVPGGSDPGSGAQGGGGSGVIAAGRGEGGTETHLALASEAVNRALPQLGEGSALVWLREQQLQGRPTSDTKDLAGVLGHEINFNQLPIGYETANSAAQGGVPAPEATDTAAAGPPPPPVSLYPVPVSMARALHEGDVAYLKGDTQEAMRRYAQAGVYGFLPTFLVLVRTGSFQTALDLLQAFSVFLGTHAAATPSTAQPHTAKQSQTAQPDTAHLHTDWAAIAGPLLAKHLGTETYGSGTNSPRDATLVRDVDESSTPQHVESESDPLTLLASWHQLALACQCAALIGHSAHSVSSEVDRARAPAARWQGGMLGSRRSMAGGVVGGLGSFGSLGSRGSVSSPRMSVRPLQPAQSSDLWALSGPGTTFGLPLPATWHPTTAPDTLVGPHTPQQTVLCRLQVVHSAFDLRSLLVNTQHEGVGHEGHNIQSPGSVSVSNSVGSSGVLNGRRGPVRLGGGRRRSMVAVGAEAGFADALAAAAARQTAVRVSTKRWLPAAVRRVSEPAVTAGLLLLSHTAILQVQSGLYELIHSGQWPTPEALSVRAPLAHPWQIHWDLLHTTPSVGWAAALWRAAGDWRRAAVFALSTHQAMKHQPVLQRRLALRPSALDDLLTLSLSQKPTSVTTQPDAQPDAPTGVQPTTDSVDSSTVHPNSTAQAHNDSTQSGDKGTQGARDRAQGDGLNSNSTQGANNKALSYPLLSLASQVSITDSLEGAGASGALRGPCLELGWSVLVDQLGPSLRALEVSEVCVAMRELVWIPQSVLGAESDVYINLLAEVSRQVVEITPKRVCIMPLMPPATSNVSGLLDLTHTNVLAQLQAHLGQAMAHEYVSAHMAFQCGGFLCVPAEQVFQSMLCSPESDGCLKLLLKWHGRYDPTKLASALGEVFEFAEEFQLADETDWSLDCFTAMLDGALQVSELLSYQDKVAVLSHFTSSVSHIMEDPHSPVTRHRHSSTQGTPTAHSAASGAGPGDTHRSSPPEGRTLQRRNTAKAFRSRVERVASRNGALTDEIHTPTLDPTLHTPTSHTAAHHRTSDRGSTLSAPASPRLGATRASHDGMTRRLSGDHHTTSLTDEGSLVDLDDLSVIVDVTQLMNTLVMCVRPHCATAVGVLSQEYGVDMDGLGGFLGVGTHMRQPALQAVEGTAQGAVYGQEGSGGDGVGLGEVEEAEHASDAARATVFRARAATAGLQSDAIAHLRQLMDLDWLLVCRAHVAAVAAWLDGAAAGDAAAAPRDVVLAQELLLRWLVAMLEGQKVFSDSDMQLAAYTAMTRVKKGPVQGKVVDALSAALQQRSIYNSKLAEQIRRLKALATTHTATDTTDTLPTITPHTEPATTHEALILPKGGAIVRDPDTTRQAVLHTTLTMLLAEATRDPNSEADTITNNNVTRRSMQTIISQSSPPVRTSDAGLGGSVSAGRRTLTRTVSSSRVGQLAVAASVGTTLLQGAITWRSRRRATRDRHETVSSNGAGSRRGGTGYTDIMTCVSLPWGFAPSVTAVSAPRAAVSGGMEGSQGGDATVRASVGDEASSGSLTFAPDTSQSASAGSPATTTGGTAAAAAAARGAQTSPRSALRTGRSLLRAALENTPDRGDAAGVSVMPSAVDSPTLTPAGLAAGVAHSPGGIMSPAANEAAVNAPAMDTLQRLMDPHCWAGVIGPHPHTAVSPTRSKSPPHSRLGSPGASQDTPQARRTWATTSADTTPLAAGPDACDSHSATSRAVTSAVCDSPGAAESALRDYTQGTLGSAAVPVEEEGAGSSVHAAPASPGGPMQDAPYVQWGTMVDSSTCSSALSEANPGLTLDPDLHAFTRSASLPTPTEPVLIAKRPTSLPKATAADPTTKPTTTGAEYVDSGLVPFLLPATVSEGADSTSQHMGADIEARDATKPRDQGRTGPATGADDLRVGDLASFLAEPGAWSTPGAVLEPGPVRTMQSAAQANRGARGPSGLRNASSVPNVGSLRVGAEGLHGSEGHGVTPLLSPGSLPPDLEVEDSTADVFFWPLSPANTTLTGGAQSRFTSDAGTSSVAGPRLPPHVGRRAASAQSATTPPHAAGAAPHLLDFLRSPGASAASSKTNSPESHLTGNARSRARARPVSSLGLTSPGSMIRSLDHSGAVSPVNDATNMSLYFMNQVAIDEAPDGHPLSGVGSDGGSVIAAVASRTPLRRVSSVVDYLSHTHTPNEDRNGERDVDLDGVAVDLSSAMQARASSVEFPQMPARSPLRSPLGYSGATQPPASGAPVRRSRSPAPLPPAPPAVKAAVGVTTSSAAQVPLGLPRAPPAVPCAPSDAQVASILASVPWLRPVLAMPPDQAPPPLSSVQWAQPQQQQQTRPVSSHPITIPIQNPAHATVTGSVTGHSPTAPGYATKTMGTNATVSTGTTGPRPPLVQLNTTLPQPSTTMNTNTSVTRAISHHQSIDDFLALAQEDSAVSVMAAESSSLLITRNGVSAGAAAAAGYVLSAAGRAAGGVGVGGGMGVGSGGDFTGVPQVGVPGGASAGMKGGAWAVAGGENPVAQQRGIPAHGVNPLFR